MAGGGFTSALTCVRGIERPGHRTGLELVCISTRSPRTPLLKKALVRAPSPWPLFFRISSSDTLAPLPRACPSAVLAVPPDWRPVLRALFSAPGLLADDVQGCVGVSSLIAPVTCDRRCVVPTMRTPLPAWRSAASCSRRSLDAPSPAPRPAPRGMRACLGSH